MKIIMWSHEDPWKVFSSLVFKSFLAGNFYKSSRTRFFLRSFSRASWWVTSTNPLERGQQPSSTLQMGRFSASSASTLLALFLTYVDGSRGSCGPKCLACTATPFTLCDVPSPDNFSSRWSMLSHAKVMPT